MAVGVGVMVFNITKKLDEIQKFIGVIFSRYRMRYAGTDWSKVIFQSVGQSLTVKVLL